MKRYLLGMMLSSMMAACSQQTALLDTNRAIDYCISQVNRSLDSLKHQDGTCDYTMEPRNILEGEIVWNCRKASAEEWCSGFWPGILWMTYGITKDDSIRKQAEGFTEALSFLASRPVYDHDLGFLVVNSFLKGYDQTNNEAYKQIALTCADSLATLFNPRAGTLLSWPRHIEDYGGHNTIMDNMINLELLLWASQNGSDKRLAEIAVSHAETTMKHQFREDGSCYHVAIYDQTTGDFIKGMTHQGYADSSMWSRGQSWAIYGYTMVYRYTHDKRFLDFAQKVTDIYLKRLQETSDDWIPLWDMDDPRGLQAPKDASAASIVASALIELSQYTDQKGDAYRAAAENMLHDLSTEKYQSRQNKVAFLMHSTGHHPAGSEIDASIIYADYYYLEALIRHSDMISRH